MTYDALESGNDHKYMIYGQSKIEMAFCLLGNVWQQSASATGLKWILVWYFEMSQNNPTRNKYNTYGTNQQRGNVLHHLIKNSIYPNILNRVFLTSTIKFPIGVLMKSVKPYVQKVCFCFYFILYMSSFRVENFIKRTQSIF